ncbi:MAG: sulfatase-like hydrolase/transferase [Gammaproteobacteria bacterium]|nr:sulfatase-like hydrolase/transferase [Gammaproteobacteria bacterium]
MKSLWSYVLLLVPVFDLLVSFLAGQAPAGESGRPPLLGLVLGGVSQLFGWLMLFFLLSLLYGLLNRWDVSGLKRVGRFLLVILLSTISAYLIFYWSFLATNGFAPSDDAILFLFQNLERLPQHILQTSPVAAAIFLVLSVLLGLLAHTVFSRTEPLLSGRSGLKLSGAAMVAFLAWQAVIPYAAPITPVQSMLGWQVADPLAQAQQSAIHFEQKQKYEPVTLQKEQRGPVVVVLIESLRRDLLELSPSPIPFLKSLQNEAVMFDKAYATASHSNYADLAFWYSQYPLRSAGLQRYPRGAAWRGDSLFSAFKAHDYRTAYISSQNEKWGEMINWLEVDEVDYFYHSEDFKGDTWFNEDDKFGVKMMIEKGVATAGKIEDSSTFKVAEQWIESLGGRGDFFLGLNLQNTHFSYVIPPGGDEPFQPADMGFKAVYFRWPEEKKQNVKNRYLNAVYNVDGMLKDFVSFLKAEGLWDSTTFVVVGDSGEAFYEHGFGNHSGPMYEEVMRTFALIKPPVQSSKRPGHHLQPVSHIDLAAAILDLKSIPVPDGFQGVSPFDRSEERPVFMHTNAIIKQNAIVEWPWKLLQTYYPVERLELYNLEQDASEFNDLSAARPELAQRLDHRLSSWVLQQIRYYSDPAYYSQLAPPKNLN